MENSILQPRTLEALAEALSLPARKILIAGGTDIMIRLRIKPVEDHCVVDLSQMAPLREYGRNEQGLRIGALCTMTELSESALLQEWAGVLASAAAHVGSTQIRNRATVGGNVANAAQCADTIPALIALEADVELMDGSGAVRSIPVEDFVTGIGKTLITQQEAVTGFFIPNRSLSLRGGYGKIGSRKAVTIAKINGAGVLKIEEGIVTYARTAFGSLGQRGFHSPDVSAALTGMTLEQLQGEAYMDCFVEQVERAIPGRDSLEYKRSAVRAVAAAIIEQAMTGHWGC